MTMASFLEALRYALGNMNSQQKDDILSEFEAHFAMAKAEGKTEDEICRSLGDPTAIANQFLTEDAEYGRPKNIRDITDSQPASKNQDNGKAYSIDGREQADIDIKKQFSPAEVTLVDIDIKHGDIKIGASKDNEVHVSVKGPAANSRFYVTCGSGRLYINEESLPFGLLRFFRRMIHNVTVTVLLPAMHKASITAHTGMGNTDISKTGGILLKVKNSAGNVDITDCTYIDVTGSSAAGNVTLTGCTADQFDIKSAAGNVKIFSSTGSLKAHTAAGDVLVKNFTGGMQLKTAAGDVKISDTTGDIDAHTAAGNVGIESGHSTGSICAKSTAGNVNIRADKISHLEANSSAGNVTVHTRYLANGHINTMAGESRLSTEGITGHVTVKSSMGAAKIMLPRDAAIRIQARSSMGRVRVEIPGDQNANSTLDVFSSMGDAVVKAI